MEADFSTERIETGVEKKATLKILKPLRVVAKRLLGPQVVKTIRRSFRSAIPGENIYLSAFAGKAALEIGGPSELFSDSGALPIYRGLRNLDNCLFSGQTLWTGEVRSGATFEFHPQKAKGNQIISEASDLTVIADRSYEAILACHCLEHLANPLRALEEWKRVSTNDGLLLLVLPHKDGTFDWRRPTTALAHMIEDFENRTDEGDLTHVPEILALHDLERDRPAGSAEQFRQRCLNNLANRAIHHHVFDTLSALKLVDYAGYRLIQVNPVKPFHIVILARRCEEKPDNSQFLEAGPEFRDHSFFPSDREQGR